MNALGMTNAAYPCHGRQGTGDSGLMNRNIGNEFAPTKCSDDSETNSSGGKLNDWAKIGHDSGTTGRSVNLGMG